jgi:hypothetical protein
MKALSIKNPWAYMIFHEGKNVENRTYSTKFRGKLLIHASKKSMNIGDCLAIMPVRFSVLDILNLNIYTEALNGLILGSVQLVDCVQSSKSEWAQKGCWHWIFENPVLLPEPIPALGKLGFWEFNENILP